MLKFSIRVILLEEEEPVLFRFYTDQASPAWESRLGEHQIDSETSEHLIKLTKEVQDGRFTQALNGSLYTGRASDQKLLLKGTRALSFTKTGVHNHSFEEPLSVRGEKTHICV